MDKHFQTETDFRKNIPGMMALIDFYHINIQGYLTKAISPYSEPLHSFLLHIAQLEMESNGKKVFQSPEGIDQNFSGGIVFGGVGSNCQHSFFQLVHQGRVIPVEFIAFANNQLDKSSANHPISHHEELMMNYFAQVRSLALGRTYEEVQAANPDVCPEKARHMTFEGNRPSSSLLLESLTSRALGQLFSIYENKVTVEGFLCGLNSFDQFGVELGKTICTGLRQKVQSLQSKEEKIATFQEDEVSGQTFKFFFEKQQAK